jgi:drug/metabolite transporter (DMT)-like permease
MCAKVLEPLNTKKAGGSSEDLGDCAAVYLEEANTSAINVNEARDFKPTSFKWVCAYVGLYALSHCWGKWLMLQPHGVTPFEILYTRGFVSVIASLIYLKSADLYLFDVAPNKSSLVLTAALVGFLGQCGFYLSLYLLSMTEAVALDCLPVLVSSFLDCILFKGRYRFYQFLGYMSAMLGVVFLVRPSYLFQEINDPEVVLSRRNFAYGMIAGLLGSQLNGLYTGLLQKTGSKVDSMISFTYKQFAMALFAPCLVLIHFEVRAAPTEYTLSYLISLLCIAGLSWACTYSLYKALFEEKLLTRIQPFKYLILPLTLILDAFLFNSNLLAFSYLGLAFISVNFLIALYYLFYAPQ